MENPNTPVTLDNPVTARDESEASDQRPYPRVDIDEVTGCPIVTVRPGPPWLTSEMVREELEDFP